MKTILKRFVHYSMWFRGLKKVRAMGSLERMVPIVDLLLSFSVTETDKTLLIYAIVTYSN